MFSGEELTICYVEKGRPKEERIKDLQESFFFQCSCSLCSPLSPCSLSSRSLGSVSCSSSFPKYGEDVLELSEKMMKAIVCSQCSGSILNPFFSFLVFFFLFLFFSFLFFSSLGEFNKVLKRIWDCHQPREREREERRKGGRNRRRGRGRGRRRREMGM